MAVKLSIAILVIYVGIVMSCLQSNEKNAVCLDTNPNLLSLKDTVVELTIRNAVELKIENVPEKTSIQNLIISSKHLNVMDNGFLTSLMTKENKNSLELEDLPIRLEKRHFDRMGDLKILRLYNISNLSGDVFDELSGLQELSIVGSDIEMLPKSTESLITHSLRRLNIKKTNIKALPWSAIRHRLASSKIPLSLNLDKSKIDCSNSELIEILKNKNLPSEQIEESKCSSPKEYEGYSLVELKPEIIDAIVKINQSNKSESNSTKDTIKANIEVIAVIVSVVVLAFLIFTIFIIFRFCRKRSGKGKDYQKSLSHTQQIEKKYELLDQDNPVSF